jgi:aminoglycoside phosphotransferase (APT) family kinase protein
VTVRQYGCRMRRLPHGYTNETLGDAATVVKRYTGPDAATRAAREYAALVALPGRVPVPPVLGHTPTTITLGFVAGMHGQDLIAASQAEPVLRTCGAVLRDIHNADFNHGDFGPQNMLLDPITFAATAVLDWEFSAHPRIDPVPDLAWCEWIVRTHHPGSRGALAAFFTAYGTTPSWKRRHAAMLARCHQLLSLAHRRDPDGPTEELWRQRIATTARWREDG